MGSVEWSCAILTCIGMIMIIAAIMSSTWTTGCMSFDNIIAAVRKLMQGQELPANFDRGAAMLRGMQLCIHQGLFKVSMIVAEMNVSLSISDSSIPTYVVITAMGLFSALACTLAAAVFHGMAAAGSSESYEGRSRMSVHTYRAMILLVLAVLLGLVGMTAYAVGTAHLIHQPLQYMEQFREGMKGSLPGMMNGHGMSYDGSQLKYTGQTGKKITFNISQSRLEEYHTAISEGMDPTYGSSFIVGWVSILFILAAFGLTVLAKRNHGRETHNREGDDTTDASCLDWTSM